MDIVPQLFINSLISGSLYALIALGLTLTFGATRFFNFAHGSLALIGAYTVFALVKWAHLNVVLSVILGVIAAGLGGVLLEWLIFSRLRKKKSTNLVAMIASLGALTCIQAILSLIFSSQFLPLSDPYEPVQVYTVWGAAVTQYQITAMVVSVAVASLLVLFINHTLTGKKIKALSDDEEVSRIVGINTGRIVMIVFAISGAIAGIAGIAVGYDTGLDPALGLHLFLKGIISSIIGGIGSVGGTLFGAFLLGFVENFGVWKIAAEWKDAIAFGLLIIFLIVRPEGIFKK